MEKEESRAIDRIAQAASSSNFVHLYIPVVIKLCQLRCLMLATMLPGTINRTARTNKVMNENHHRQTVLNPRFQILQLR